VKTKYTLSNFRPI